ncbi:methylmalonyl Co-A mutase-associated GTPase MeaB [Metallosphaera hakonensis]|uniref:Methylmalonyl Co-A mutase-associated GTPase MeaB n=1 Tax=Metallosphaera hakonensis JCM 8857 = DSM 7519 TaxID=1293036 RepID=A0A2U9IUK8_9CREN|nr:methylmalonyl Co-A mutase-associated GTPase MeaB [Metallosphaera hakonensis]AWR99673.1 methylmalonyl Co-A mutase-associated GTPase MeaB [Metallosphaera hakonensis JCM 8857 = DSM 7519]
MSDDLLSKALQGDELSISKVLTNIEYNTNKGIRYLSELSKLSGRAHTIGITGIPGAGKSTLISDLIEAYASAGHKVGVIMIDPSSPLSMGSLMGNRIRMQDKSLLENVFIRSIASRGHLGGFSSEAIMLTEALDGLGYDKIIVETVGAGQTDTEVMSITHTVAVLVIPGTGDEIQALKAGIMEIGDIYVINKYDKPEADAVYDAVKFVIESGELSFRDEWKPRICKVSALKKTGIQELVNTFEEHVEFLRKKELFNTRIKRRRIKMIELLLRRRVNEVISKAMERDYNEVDELLSQGKIEELITKLSQLIKEQL